VNDGSITKFTKILCHENLELYGMYTRGTGINPASSSGSKVTYAVKRTERETAWERG